MSKRLVTKLLLRRDTSANLANIVLAQGEPCYAIDTCQFKIGDGVTDWEHLDSYGGSFVTSVAAWFQLSASGAEPPTGNWVQTRLTGTKQTPWIWTRYDYEFSSSPTVSIYNRVYDASWKGYTFVGDAAPVTTTFPCEVSSGVLTIGSPTDLNGEITTSGTFTPTGTIEVQ